MGVAVALAVALAFSVSSLFKGDVGAYIQATSTVFLVAITTSYVVATHAMARTAGEQLTLQRNQRAIAAATELWESYCEVEPIGLQVVADIRSMWRQTETDVNQYSLYAERRRVRVRTLGEFSTTVRRLAIHLGEDVRDPAVALGAEYDRLARVANLLDSHVLDEIVYGTSNERGGFDVGRLRDTWGVLSEVADHDLPSWGQLGEFTVAPEAARAEAAFLEAVNSQVRNGDSGT